MLHKVEAIFPEPPPLAVINRKRAIPDHSAQRSPETIDDIEAMGRNGLPRRTQRCVGLS
jgi:hypothetical protein